MFYRLSLLTAVCLLPTSLLHAEQWLEMTDLVPKCPLIVHVKLEHEPTTAGQRPAYAEVVEVLAGDYHPHIFAVEPPKNRVAVEDMKVPEKGEPAKHLIVFYGHNSHNANGFLTRPDMTLVVENDAVVYPPRREPGETKSYPLADFKRMIKAIASDIAADKNPSKILAAKRAARFPNRPSSWDLSGEWRMFLPAGFEHAITLTKISEGRYEIAPRHLVGNGVFEIEGADLVFVEGDKGISAGAFRWTVTSKHLMTLTKQTHNAGSDYTGAILFRAKEKK